jgi:hypothetical protein
MIERLSESTDAAFGFKATGRVTARDAEAFAPQVALAIGRCGSRKIGILADLSAMEAMDWKARLSEIRFLREHAESIARVAVVGAHKWEDIVAEVLAGTVLVEAETRYFQSEEASHAWHWVKTGQGPGSAPVRRIYPREGLMKDYVPEYTGV